MTAGVRRGRAAAARFAALTALALAAGVPSPGAAQGGPAPSPSPPASPAAASPLGPALGPNDTCTTISAIVTRPTVTNAVCTVRPNHAEIEGGYQNTSYPGGGNLVAYPQALIRVGTTIPALEVQVVPPNVLRATSGGPAVTGVSDAGFGLKYVVGSSPKMVYGVQANATVPSGSAAFSANGTQYLYAAQASYGLSPALSLTAGAQDQILFAGGRAYGSFVPSLVLSASLAGATSLYVEGAQFTRALGPGTPTRTQFIYGVARGVGQRLQLDLEAGFSPTDATGHYHYVGFGFGYGW